MFENYIKTAKQQILEKYPKNTPFIYLRDVLGQQNLDLFYKGYLTAEVNWWIYEEQMLRKSNVNFAVDEIKLGTFLQEMDNLYFENARFDLPGLRTVIDSAVKIRLNYALRPRTTLKWFVFRGEPTKSFNEIQLRLDYFAEQRYLIDEFIRKIENEQIVNKDKDILSVIEFERMIESIDNEQIFEMSPEDFAELTQPIFDFFAGKDPELAPEHVPTECLIIFLDDKGLTPLSNKLKEHFYDNNLKTISKSRFLEFLFEVIKDMDESITPEISIQNNIIHEKENVTLPPSEELNSSDFILPAESAGKLDAIIESELNLKLPQADSTP